MPNRRLPNSDKRDSIRLLREMTGRKHVLLTGRGAAGVWAALRALDFHDRAVLLPANTCYIVLWAVLRSGNYPVLLDADVSSPFLPSLSNEKPAAMIPCHLYGLPAPMGKITHWARENNVFVIEDAALALGAMVEGRPAGSWGDASILSFGLGKIADHELGGAFLTDDDVLATEVEKCLAAAPEWDDRLLAFTNQWNGLYWSLHQYESQNPQLLELYPRLFEIYGDLTAYRLPASHWRGLPETLTTLSDNLAHRARLAGLYDRLIAEMGKAHLAPTDNPLLQTIARPSGSILWRYPLLVAPEIRDDLLAYLWENGIHDATRWYPSLRYMTAALAPHVQQAPTPHADALAASIINLRLDSGVDESAVEQSITIIRDFFSENDT